VENAFVEPKNAESLTEIKNTILSYSKLDSENDSYEQ